jgi:hypothetical protein
MKKLTCINLSFLHIMLVWGCAFLIHAGLAWLLRKIAPKMERRAPLEDVIHTLVSDKYRNLRPIIDAASGLPLVIFLMTQHGTALELLMKRHALILLLRSLCFTMTILPDASSDSLLRTQHVWWLAGGVHDLMFSGHASMLWLVRDVYVDSGLITTFSRYLLTVYNVLVSLGIVVARNHYSVDVFVAFIASEAVRSWVR